MKIILDSCEVTIEVTMEKSNLQFKLTCTLIYFKI